MTPENRNKLEARVTTAADAALQRQGYVSAIDVLRGIGWLDQSTLKRWKQGQVRHLEGGMQANLARIAEAMKLFRGWANAKGLLPSETAYVAKSSARPKLRFSVSGDEGIERNYRTHWVSPELSAKKRERIEAAANRPPELVVVLPLDPEWKCHRCGGTGDFLIMEDPGPSCLECAGLGDLVYLPAGDANLSRRAKAKSEVHAVVVRFSRTRKRNERQGLLVKPEALREAESELG
ncbi:MAG: hypothetical protein HOO96_16980 [Polyangiaceae bacterium]|nr:hypothetical protein [Polyangiaceae bacterium]